VLVVAVNRAGALEVGRRHFSMVRDSAPFGGLAVSLGIATLSNLVNNLPAGLLARGAIQAFAVPAQVRDAV
jgi:Na+/H+ antiporter NhaD/arsenite permease-like protein